MTVTSSTNKDLHTGNGSLTAFPYTFRMDADADLEVYIDDTLQGSGFTIARNGNDMGGTVTFSIAPVNGVIITLLRNLSLSQETDYTPYDAFPADAHEGALDKLTMIAQQIQEEVDRNSQSIGTEPGVDTTAPPYEAGKGWMWDPILKKIINSNDDLNSVIGYGQTAESAANAAGVSETNAAASEVATAADAIATAADVVTIAGSEAATSADAVQTALDVISSGTNATNAQLEAWNAEAEAITADSYAIQEEDVFVNIYTSDGDGTFTATPTTDYSAYHWSVKAASAAGGGEANTASNLGAGTGVFGTKSGVLLQFKSLIGSGVTLTNDANTVTLTTSPTILGLGNVDNTSDVDKPVSTAQQTALTGKSSGTGSSAIPSGTTAQRDVSPSSGYFRYNSDLSYFEGFNGTSWQFAGGVITVPDWSGIALTGADLTAVGIIGANPEAKIYPDGSVVGSSDNGNFTKYPNGDLVCNVNLTSPTGVVSAVGQLFRSDSSYWTYPIEFTGERATVSANPTGVYVWGVIQSTNILATIRMFSATSVTSPPNFQATATGRWKT